MDFRDSPDEATFRERLRTWLSAHAYLRRALTSTGLWPVTIREIADGLS
nr:hypothetical protein [Mycobacterium sp.]